MDLLSLHIQAMTKEELRSFKLFAKRSNDDKDRKDVLLFDLFAKSKQVDEEKFFKKLYSCDDKNPYYRLKNRVVEDIATSMFALHTNKNPLLQIFKYLGTFELFHSRGEFLVAHSNLKKAEKIAVTSKQLEILDLIYVNFIKLSNDILEINPELYIERQKSNAIELNKTRTMDQLLATLNYRLKRAQNFAKGDKGFLKIVSKTIKEFEGDLSLIENKLYQIKIYKAVSQIMITQHNFTDLEEYVLKTFKQFLSKNWFDKKNHDLKLEMLIYIINAKFYNRKYHEALQFAATLYDGMLEFEKFYFEKYLFFYYNSLVVNYAHTNLKKALEAIGEFEGLMRKRNNSFYDQFIYLNRATLSYETEKYADGIRSLMKLYVSPAYNKIDKTFRFKIEIAELIMQYEYGDLVALKKRIEQVRKNTDKDIFIQAKRDLALIGFLARLSEGEALIRDSKITIEMTLFARKKTDKMIEDTEVIRYNSWVEKKLASLKR